MVDALFINFQNLCSFFSPFEIALMLTTVPEMQTNLTDIITWNSENNMCEQILG